MTGDLKMSEEKIAIICSQLKEGMSRTKAAQSVGITRQTFLNWYKGSELFKQRVDEAENEYQLWRLEGIKADSLNSLKSLICGVEYDEVTEETRLDRSGKPITLKKVTHKKVLPNVTAVIFALCNRDPERWQNKVTGDIKQEVKTANLNGTLSLDKVPDDVLAKVLDFMRDGN